MNKNLHRVLLITALVTGNIVAGDAVSQTSLTVRPQFQLGDPLWCSLFHNDRMMSYECGIHGALEIVPFGGQTTQDWRIGKYFMPFNKCTLLAAETGAIDTLNRDIDPLHFNIETINDAFESIFTITPKQSVAAVGFDYKQALSTRESGCVKWWLEILTSVVHVRNTICLVENVIDTGGGAKPGAIGLDGAPVVGNMTEAFMQSNWNYGKIISGKPLTKTRLSDIELIIGWNACHTEMCHYNGYAGVIIPTGNKPQGRYVFEPIVGNNRHIGITYGSNMGFEFWRCGEHLLRSEIDINGRYLFRNKQIRSFDLYDKSWSRYMETYSSIAQAEAAAASGDESSGTSGINVFTQCVKVSPRFSAVVNWGMLYSYCNFEAEFGWNFFGRQAEQVCLNFNTDAALKDSGGLGQTTIARTIGHQFDCDANPEITIPVANYKPLTTSDVNIDSAATPATISNIIYATLGYNWDCRRPILLAIGGSYEFSHVNTALQRWTAWGKFAFSF